ncbi:MAG: SNF2-related protein, partial [Thermoplasmataceae archaeon]
MVQFLGYLQDRYQEESGRQNTSSRERFDGLFYDEVAGWICDLPRFGVDVPPEFSTARMPFTSLLPKILRREEIAVYDTDFDKRRILNRDETQAAMAAADRIREAFVQFLWADAERSEQIAKRYNETFNRWVAPSYEAPEDTHYPGMSEEYRALLYPTQRNAIMRCAIEGRGLIAHEVGMGKTIVQVAAAMEMRRSGRARRPVLVVRKSTLVQFSQTAQWLYPNARFLVMSHEDLDKKRRAQFLAQAASNDYDAIVMTHEVFAKLRVSREQFESVLLEEVSSLRTALERLREAGARRVTVKSIALRISTLKARMKKAVDESKKDPGLLMDRDLGIDALFVDEAHLYKNLGSARSMDLLVKTRVVHRARGGDRMGVFLSTGTPVSNTLNEIHTMWNYIAPDQLEAMGIATLPAFRSAFIGEKAHWEPHHAGAGWRIRTRDFLVNAPDVIRGLLTVMDRKTVDRDAADTIRRPGHSVVTVEVPMTSRQQEVMEEVASAALNPDKEGSGHIFALMDRAAKCSTDMRLLDDGLDGSSRAYAIEDGSKLPSICDRVVEIYNRGADVSGAQMVFLDQGTPGGDGPNLYESLKTLLVDRAIPEDAIAFIHDATTDLARAALFDRVNSGSVRVLVGSTGKMGEGVNAQERLSAVHIVSPPWRPDIVEQAIGRAVRQGNIHEKVTTLFYSSVSRAGAVSPDAFRYQLLQTKLTAFAALLRGDMTDRTFSLDVAMTYGEIAAAASGNPMVLEKFRAEQATEEALSHLRFLMNDRSRLMIEMGTLDGGIAWKTRRRAYFDAFPRLRGEIQTWTHLEGDRETVFDHREAMEVFLKKHAAVESKQETAGVPGFRPQPVQFRMNGILISRKRAVGSEGEAVRGQYHWVVELLRPVEHPDSGVSVRSARFKSLDALLGALTPEAILAECERMDREVFTAETRKQEVKARIAGLSDGEIPTA